MTYEKPYAPARRVLNNDMGDAFPSKWHAWHPASFASFDEDGHIPTEAVAYCGAVLKRPTPLSSVDPIENARQVAGMEQVGKNCPECVALLASGEAFTESWQRAFRAEHGL